MRKRKMTTEEKKELRQEAKSWNEMIKRLTRKQAIIEDKNPTGDVPAMAKSESIGWVAPQSC